MEENPHMTWERQEQFQYRKLPCYSRRGSKTKACRQQTFLFTSTAADQNSNSNTTQSTLSLLTFRLPMIELHARQQDVTDQSNAPFYVPTTTSQRRTDTRD
ncbi:hypothetical protein BaRGS_00004093 [Batillaria attramentaria]|uniref:Uncharacterized protein n=1 Tax=Batillaria attramentaria TaxID=370345 RepID=A0ABD0LYU7_9CAEN